MALDDSWFTEQAKGYGMGMYGHQETCVIRSLPVDFRQFTEYIDLLLTGCMFQQLLKTVDGGLEL